jgi:hypothetical protein
MKISNISILFFNIFILLNLTGCYEKTTKVSKIEKIEKVDKYKINKEKEEQNKELKPMESTIPKQSNQKKIETFEERAKKIEIYRNLNFNNIEIKEDKLTELKFFNNTLSNFENNKLKNFMDKLEEISVIHSMIFIESYNTKGYNKAFKNALYIKNTIINESTFIKDNIKILNFGNSIDTNEDKVVLYISNK